MRYVGIVAELFRMLWHRRAWVLFPPVVMLVIVAALAILGQSSPLAPLLYPLF